MAGNLETNFHRRPLIPQFSFEGKEFPIAYYQKGQPRIPGIHFYAHSDGNGNGGLPEERPKLPGWTAREIIETWVEEIMGTNQEITQQDALRRARKDLRDQIDNREIKMVYEGKTLAECRWAIVPKPVNLSNPPVIADESLEATARNINRRRALGWIIGGIGFLTVTGGAVLYFHNQQSGKSSIPVIITPQRDPIPKPVHVDGTPFSPKNLMPETYVMPSDTESIFSATIVIEPGKQLIICQFNDPKKHPAIQTISDVGGIFQSLEGPRDFTKYHMELHTPLDRNTTFYDTRIVFWSVASLSEPTSAMFLFKVPNGYTIEDVLAMFDMRTAFPTQVDHIIKEQLAVNHPELKGIVPKIFTLGKEFNYTNPTNGSPLSGASSL